MKTMHSEIHIDAAPEVVWEHLMDLESWETWNPFVIEAAGKMAVGSTLEVTLRPPGGTRTFSFSPTVVESEPHRRFAWLGRTGLANIADGRHIFELESTDGGTRLTHREEFTGIAVWLVWPIMRKAEPGFTLMNEALKARVEAQRSTDAITE